MTDGTIKVLLMVMLLGGLVGATYVPETWESLPMFVARTMAVVWSAIALSERTLQHAFLKRFPSGANRASAQISA
jgi:hypothetical protein